ncbi:MAG: hypothetical protein ACTSWY_03230 [Promethearchaeota archaeon]
MKFCPECDNILIPKKNNPKVLFCKVCNKTFETDKKMDNIQKEYKISRKKKETVISRDSVVERRTKKTISDEDRRSFEDLLFGN